MEADLFADCSGDSVLRASGAQYRVGREARDEFDESYAPEESDDKTMGNSILIQLREVDEHVPFKHGEGREYWHRFHLALMHAAPRPVSRSLYERSKEDGELVSFFKRRSIGGDSGWLLYRYHPRTAKSLLEEALRTDKIYYEAGLMPSALASAFHHAEIYKGYMPDYPEMRQKIKKQAFESHDPIKKANALLMFVARKEDVPKLMELVRDHSKIQWRTSNGDKVEGYLIAKQALHTLEDLDIDERSGLLRQIALDDEVPEPIAKLANAMYERHEGEYAIKTEDKDSNSKGDED
ncbi:MAG: hypothetical protein KGZ25_15370 [Planctomycetes bacterium]|nr:hypothetical protein [Planctomycetota bacterium]